MKIEIAFGQALKRFRVAKGLGQEEFPNPTYMSVHENGKRVPTIAKIEEYASILKVCPISLLAYGYLIKDSNLTTDEVLETVKKELSEIAVFQHKKENKLD